MFKPIVVLLSALYFKCLLFIVGLYYRLFGKDKSVRMPGYNPGLMYNSRTVVIKKTKTLILIRHAESVWNEVFNREMDWGFPLRFLTGVFCELILFVTNDSYFFDSPLSDRGIKQASDLHRFIRSITESDLPKDMEKSWRALTGNTSSTDTEKKEEAKHIPIVTSPLRRCVETVCLALFARLQKSSKKVIYTHSGLQELTGNFDGISLARKSKLPPLSSTFDILKSYYIMQAQSQTQSESTVAEEELNDKNKNKLPITQDRHIQSNLQKVNQILENDYKLNLNEIKTTAENTIKENVQKVSENVTANINLEMPPYAKQKIQETSDLLKSSLPSVKITEKNELKDLTEEFAMVKNWKEWMVQRMDNTFTDGFKPRSKRGDERIDGFINWLFNEEPCMDSEIVVICGHSAWLRSFFKSYLPRDSTHIAKTHKVQNAGIIQCQVTQFIEPQDPFKKNRYCIHPESIQLVRGSFQRYLKTF